MTHDDDYCDCDLSDKEYKYLKKYFKRTGIFRMYRMLNFPKSETQLMLEFVVRGKVLFTIDLWKRKGTIFNEEHK